MPKDPAGAGKGHENRLFFFARLKAHAGAGGNVQPHATRLFAREHQCAVDFEEVIVTSYLNRTVACMAVTRSGVT